MDVAAVPGIAVALQLQEASNAAASGVHKNAWYDAGLLHAESAAVLHWNSSFTLGVYLQPLRVSSRNWKEWSKSPVSV